MEIIVRNIGSSKGIILRQTILEKYNIKDKVELILENDQIVLKVPVSARENWDEKFKKMSEKNDDTLLIDDVFEDEDIEGW